MRRALPGPAPALRALLAGVIDYAGLFPPAALPMADAVAAWSAHRAGAEAWLLGRFVVPVGQLGELARAQADAGAPAPWRLAVLATDDLASTLREVDRFTAAHGDRFDASVLEARLGSVAAIEAAGRLVAGHAILYAEIPIADDPAPLLAAVKGAGLRAKVRTGGLTPEAFPTAAQLARFLVRCAAEALPFKATAGLHHPVRAEHRLTYEPDAPRGTMFGFLNVFAAAALARTGADDRELADLLDERAPGAFELAGDSFRWRGHELPASELAAARETFAIAFGSCSVREPANDLHQLGLL